MPLANRCARASTSKFTLWFRPWTLNSSLSTRGKAREAMTLARRAAKKGHVFLADADCLPQTLAVLRTRAEPLGIHLVVEPVTAEVIARLEQGGPLVKE